MKRMIYAEDVIKNIDEWLDAVGTAYVRKGVSYYGELLGCIEDAPTIEPPKGEWMVCDDLFADATVVKCSACGATEFVSNHVLLEVTDVKMHNFCPNCGARMKGE